MTANLKLVWSRHDAIDTAQAFHAEIDNAETGVPERASHWTRFLFGSSRFRRARIYDGMAVGLLMTFMAALGVVVYAASAKADDTDDAAAVAYTAEYGPAVCSVLDDYPSFAGIMGIGQAIIENHGFTTEQAGQAIALSVIEICPRHAGLLNRFISVYGHGQVA